MDTTGSAHYLISASANIGTLKFDMAVMMGSLYDALRSANAPDEKALKAAEEVADFKGDIASLKGEISVLKWMVGANITLTVLVLGGLLWQ